MGCHPCRWGGGGSATAKARLAAARHRPFHSQQRLLKNVPYGYACAALGLVMWGVGRGEGGNLRAKVAKRGAELSGRQLAGQRCQRRTRVCVHIHRAAAVRAGGLGRLWRRLVVAHNLNLLRRRRGGVVGVCDAGRLLGSLPVCAPPAGRPTPPPASAAPSQSVAVGRCSAGPRLGWACECLCCSRAAESAACGIDQTHAPRRRHGDALLQRLTWCRYRRA